MLLRIVISSIRFRLNLYIPMLLAIVISLSLIGAAEIIESSFKGIVEREMGKYGANVILIPEEKVDVSEGVGLFVKTTKIRETEVNLSVTDIAELLKINPSWVVRGSGNILVGRNVAQQLNIAVGSHLEIEGISGNAAILDSGTEFDSFIFVDGSFEKPSMILIRTDEPERYRTRNAIILEEMIRTKYTFLNSIKRFMFYVAFISALCSMAAIVNLARIDAGNRRREFGVLKSLGALQHTIAKVILAEFALVSSISGIWGVIASLALSWVILSFTAHAPVLLSVKTVLYVFTTSTAAFGLASLIYVFESKKHDVIEEIKDE